MPDCQRCGYFMNTTAGVGLCRTCAPAMNQTLKTPPAPVPTPPSRCPWDDFKPADDLPTNWAPIH